MTIRLLFALAGCAAVAIGGGAVLAQLHPSTGANKAGVAQATAQNSAMPREQPGIETASQADADARAKYCSTTCKFLDGKPDYTEVCEPVVISFEPFAAIVATERPVVSYPIKQSRAAKLSKIYRVPDQLTPATAFRKRADGRLEILSTVQQCGQPPRLKSLIVQKRSPKCWIGDLAYCKYNPSGKIGYPCSCGGQSGFFQ